MYRVFCFLMQFEWQNLVEVKFMLHYAVSVKSTVKILSIFVAFLENMNFKKERNYISSHSLSKQIRKLFLKNCDLLVLSRQIVIKNWIAGFSFCQKSN